MLENSAVGAPFVRYKRAAFLEADQPVAMSLDLVAKDFRLIAELAAGQAREVPVSAAARRVVEAAVAAGHGAGDMADLRSYLAGLPRWTAEPTRSTSCERASHNRDVNHL